MPSIVDGHVHLVSVKRGGFLAPSLEKGVIFRFLKRILGLHKVAREDLDEAYVSRLLEYMGAAGAPDKVVLLAMDGRYDARGRFDEAATSFYVSNDYLFEICEQQADRFLPGASVNPRRADVLDELARVKERGAVCIKTVPNSQDFDPADPAFKPFWRALADLDLPWLTHTGYEHTIPSKAQIWGDPRRLVPALEEGARVIAAHCATAGPFAPNETFGCFVELAARYPRLYGDVSALTTFGRGKYLKRVLAELPALEGQLLYGSDYPVPASPLRMAPLVGLKAARRAQREGNLLTRHLLLAQAAGVPAAVFENTARILNTKG